MQTSLSTPTIDRLRADLGDRVIAPDDPGYDEARAVFVGGFDRRPAVIVRAADAARRRLGRRPGPRDRARAGRPQRRPQRRRPQHDRRRDRARPARPEGRSRSTSPAGPPGPETGLTAGELTTAPRRARPRGRVRRHRLGRDRRDHPRRRRRLPRPQARADDRLAARRRDRDGRRPAASGSTPRPSPTCSGRSAAAAATSAWRPASGTGSTSSTAIVGGMLVLPATAETIAGFMAAADGRARGAVDDRQRHARAADAVPARGAPRQARSSWACSPSPATPRRGAGDRAVPGPRDAARRPRPADALPGDVPAGGRRRTIRPRSARRCSSTASTATSRRRSSTGSRRPTRRSGSPSSGCSAGRWPGSRPTPPRSPIARAGSWSPWPRSTTGPRTGVVRQAWVDDFAAALHQGDDGAYVNFLNDEGPARVRAGLPRRDLGPARRRSSAATTRRTCSGSTRTSRRPDPGPAPAGGRPGPAPRPARWSSRPGRVVRCGMWAPGWAPESRWSSGPMGPRRCLRAPPARCLDAHGPPGDQQAGFAATPGRV